MLSPLYALSEIRTLHLETTTRCNASCPMCMRNLRGGKTNPGLPLVDMTLKNFKAWIEPEFIRQLTRVYLCGNYGDPAAGADALEICAYLRETNSNLRIGLFSNGSVRNEEWWSQLAKIVNYCRFGIDGLEDTNHIYRRNTSWARILKNVSAFIESGHGKAEWDFLVFKHNQHQIEEARNLARDLGFSRFRLKRSSRFKPAGFAVHNQNGEKEYLLELPSDQSLVNRALHESKELCSISCKVAKEKSVFISAEGFVFPCCWTAGEMYDWRLKESPHSVKSLIESSRGGLSAIRLSETSLGNIVEGEFFTGISKNWEKDRTPQVCSKVCGVKADAFESQFSAWQEFGAS